MQQLRHWAKQAWRATRKVLPPQVAEAIRVPTKKALRAVGLVSPPKQRRVV
jgi:hypothetical protein